MSRLKRENTHLKQQLTFQSNDILSESQIRLKPNGLNTINQHDTINSDISEDLPHVTSQGNTAKLNHKVHHKKEDTTQLAYEPIPKTPHVRKPATTLHAGNQ